MLESHATFKTLFQNKIERKPNMLTKHEIMVLWKLKEYCISMEHDFTNRTYGMGDSAFEKFQHITTLIKLLDKLVYKELESHNNSNQNERKAVC